MPQLILINGHGGAGKKSVAKLLYAALPNAAWLHMRWVLALTAWEPTPHYDDLGLRNAAAVIANYLAEGVESVIYSGNVQSQATLDRLLVLLPQPCRVLYIWLHADQATRRTRLLARNRDAGDQQPQLDWILAHFSDEPAPLVIADGSYHRIDTSARLPTMIVAEIEALLPGAAGLPERQA
jgi:hypothetical protein